MSSASHLYKLRASRIIGKPQQQQKRSGSLNSLTLNQRQEARKLNIEKSKKYSEVTFLEWFRRTNLKNISLLFRLFTLK
jgi:hypothetical protein